MPPNENQNHPKEMRKTMANCLQGWVNMCIRIDLGQRIRIDLGQRIRICGRWRGGCRLLLLRLRRVTSLPHAIARNSRGHAHLHPSIQSYGGGDGYPQRGCVPSARRCQSGRGEERDLVHFSCLGLGMPMDAGKLADGSDGGPAGGMSMLGTRKNDPSPWQP